MPMPAGGSAAPTPVSPGLKNRLINASFAINQLLLTGTVTLAAGKYGHDGFKAGSAGCTYTFVQSGLDTTITITAGSLIGTIEAGWIEGGTYAVSNAGTAQARVWQGAGASGSGSYATAPFAATGLAANTQTNVEFSTGTVLRPQIESGAGPTLFDRHPPALETLLAQRYYYAINPANYSPTISGYGGAAQVAYAYFQHPVQMYATPTVTVASSAGWNYGNCSAPSLSAASATSFTLATTVSSLGAWTVGPTSSTVPSVTIAARL